MARILAIAQKDLRQNLRDRKTFLFLLLMPAAFTLLFGFAFGKGSDGRLAVGYLDQDGGLFSPALKNLLQADLRLVEQPGQSQADLTQQVRDGKLAAAVIIPAGYSQQILADSPLKLQVIVDPASSASATLQAALLSDVGRLLMAVSAARAEGEVDAPAVESRLAAAQREAQAASQTASQADAAKPSPLQPSQTSPGMMAQFAIAGLLVASQLLVEERKTRAMQRLLTTPARRAEILLGHSLSIFVLILAQLLLLILFGQIVLKLDYLRLPWATLLLAVTTAACVAGLGLLVGALARTDEQAIIFSMICMFLFAGLGGAWVPLEVTGSAFQTLGHLTPVAWVIDGFKNIIARGLAFDSVLLPAGVLSAYAALFFALAVWKFRFE